MHTRRNTAVQENAGLGMDENAKPSDRGAVAGGKAGLGVAKKGLGGVQTRRGLRDITNKVEESGAEGAGKGGKKPGARVASASVGSADTGAVAPAASGTSLAVAAPSASSSATAVTEATPAAPAVPAASRPIRTATRTPTDIDLRDADEPLAVTEYVEDLYVFLREREIATQVDRGYMESQPNVNERMRSILIDWLVEVHLKFKLVPDTLYLTVYLIDKYLELEKVRERDRQA